MKKILALGILGIMFIVACGKNDGFAPGAAPSIALDKSPAPRVPDDNTSCLTLHATHASSGVYTIDPDGDGGPVAPLSVYCDMSTNGGGWTLVMKQKSRDGVTLQGDARYWTDSTSFPLNDVTENLNTGDENLVASAFYQVPATQLMLIAANETATRVETRSAPSAFAAFSRPTDDYSDGNNADRPGWFIHENIYPNGNALTGARFGFNLRQTHGGVSYCAVRWGWTANQDGPGASEGTADACGGLGAYGPQYGSHFMNGSKDVWQPATLLLFVR